MVKKVNNFMAIKIDFAKAYDRLEGVYGEHSSKFGFKAVVTEWISIAHFSILLNGLPYGYVTTKRYLRQGDLVSFALVTIFLDLLS